MSDIQSSFLTTAGETSWRSPSNIALIKYWGKRGIQLPQNPSLSFTLSKSFTEMKMSYSVTDKPNANGGASIDFYFEGSHNEKFKNKIDLFIQSAASLLPFAKHLHLRIESSNSFPHSTGIASSAASMSALALNLCSIEQQLTGGLQEKNEFDHKASYLARLASGSACRSVYGNLALWGQTPRVEGSSEEYAIPYQGAIHPIFEEYRDCILIVSSSEKSVSSRAGHSLMADHPFAKVRYEQARKNLALLLDAIAIGDLESFARIVENEALTLHALMMNSDPSFILLHPNTLILIESIRRFRRETKIPVCFTLDAGPNIHLLYPKSVEEEVKKWIKLALQPLCENGYTISDFAGTGPEKIQ